MNDTEELLRSQAELLAAVYGNDQYSGQPETEGLSVYRGNLAANARRALSISYPTLYKLLGEEPFDAIASAYLADAPFAEGDWGVWGNRLPQWLADYRTFQDYPYLRDVASLDWACHWCERTADASLKLESLQLLTTENPYQVRLELGAGVSIVASDYPVVDIWLAHQPIREQAGRSLDLAKEKLSAQIAQTALVWRREWKARVCSLDATEQFWMENLLKGFSLGDALDQMNGRDFRFEAWLPRAIENRIITGINTTQEIK